MNPIRSFWGWVAENEEGFHDLITLARRKSRPDAAWAAVSPLMTAVTGQLRIVHPYLGVLVGLAAEPTQFIITAYGLVEAFPAVRRVVMAAPPLQHFRVVAFRPRAVNDADLDVNGRGLSPAPAGMADFYFAYKRLDPEQIHLTVYSPLFRFGVRPSRDLMRTAILLIHNLLGEYDAGMHIGTLQFRPMPPVRPLAVGRIQPLERLRDVMDEFFPKNQRKPEPLTKR